MSHLETCETVVIDRDGVAVEINKSDLKDSDKLFTEKKTVKKKSK